MSEPADNAGVRRVNGIQSSEGELEGWGKRGSSMTWSEMNKKMSAYLKKHKLEENWDRRRNSPSAGEGRSADDLD